MDGLLAVFLTAMLPIVELRGAIPLGLISYDLPVWQVFITAILGNLVPVVLLYLFLGIIIKWLQKYGNFWQRFFSWLFARTHKRHSAKFEKYGSLALLLFVAIPLPMTGGWTGVLLAYLFGITLKHTLQYVLGGLIIAGLIVTGITLGGINLTELWTK